ncbi:MAG: ABC transporter permease [Bacteroidales bacterium]|nr:ABC transporter permease [Bacteroidales bacterium]
MIKNYFIVAIRNILKSKLFSFINVFGLALSMSVGLIVILFTADIMKSDKFNEKKESIYRITTFSEDPYRAYDFATCPVPIGNEVKENFPGVKMFTELKKTGGNLDYNGKQINGSGLFAGQEFFNIFSYELERGFTSSVLNEPYTMVVTKKLAEKLFYPEDPIGKVVKVENVGECRITGIIKDKNYRSHFQFEYLISFETNSIIDKREKTEALAVVDEDIARKLENEWSDFYSSYVYLLLDETTSTDNLVQFMNETASVHYKDLKNEKLTFGLQALTDINPGKSMVNEIGNAVPDFILIIFFAITLVIILLAAFNYTNLTIAKSMSRAREVGMRKVVGATRNEIIVQYIVEAILISFFALLLAIGIVELIIPIIQNIDPVVSEIFDLDRSFKIYSLFFLFSLIVGTFAGLFPSLYLSAFRPVNVLKGVIRIKLFAGMNIRKVLLTIQFIVSILFVVLTGLLFKQVYEINNTNLGFETNNRIVVELQGMDYKLLANEIKSNPDIVNICATSYLPVVGPWSNVHAKTGEMEKDLLINDYNIDPDFIKNMGLSLIAGRNFDFNDAVGEEKYIIVNEKALEIFKLGDKYSAIGKKIIVNDKPLIIAGVVKDYIIKTSIEEIDPVILHYIPKYLNSLIIHYRDVDNANLITFLETKWNELEKEHPFRCTIMEEQLGMINKIFNSLLGIVAYISLLSITIACLGLLGMLSFNTQTRIKEVGIRKVFGISAVKISILLSKDFIIIIAIALLITLPVVWLICDQVKMLLPNSIGFDVVAVGSGVLIIILLVLLTIISQTMKAVRTNPIDALRFE